MRPPPTPPAASLSAAADFVDVIRKRWRAGGPADAAAVLGAHPGLLRFPSLVVDLAYEEYCLAEERGAPPDPDAFCRRFPACRSQIRDAVEGHRFCADHPELFARQDEWLPPGAVVGDVVIDRPIGVGAFARVYLGRQPAAGDRAVVLKLSALRSAEGRALGTVRHPHVVEVYGAWEQDGLTALCMPYHGTGTLDKVLPPGGGRPRTAAALLARVAEFMLPAGVPVREDARPVVRGSGSYTAAALEIAVRLADALAFLHRNDTLHGDLKPSNVLLGPGGHPYLLDFNLAADAADPARRACGTLPYMAPELLAPAGSKSAAQPTTGTDVYALGVLLYELFAAAHPYAGEMPSDPKEAAVWLRGRLASPPPPLRSVAPGVGRRLSRVIDQCIHPDPAGRPATAADLHRQLVRVRDGGRPRRMVRPVAAGLLLMVGAAVAAGAVPGRRDEAANGLSTAEPAPPTTAEEFFHRGQAFLTSGDFTLAIRDFSEAYRRNPDGRTAAILSYVAGRSCQYGLAVEYGLKAIGAGYQESAIYLNLARAQYEWGHLPDAARSADEAVGRDPGSVAARYLRVRIDVKVASGGPLPRRSVEDIELVVGRHSDNFAVQHMAGSVYASAAAGEVGMRHRAVEALKKAIHLGCPIRQVTRDLVLVKYLGGLPEFESLAQLKPGPQMPAAAPPDFIDPG